MAQDAYPDGVPPPSVMSDIAPESGSASGSASGTVVSNPLVRGTYALGFFGLLAATGSDALAVAGRHTGFHLLGSIELVQAAVVLLSSAAMLIATLVGAHACVHIVTERLTDRVAARLARVAALLSALVFVAIAAGSIWVSAGLWNGFEETELRHIPLRWLRAVWIVVALLIAGRFFQMALSRTKAGARP